LSGLLEREENKEKIGVHNMRKGFLKRRDDEISQKSMKKWDKI